MTLRVGTTFLALGICLVGAGCTIFSMSPTPTQPPETPTIMPAATKTPVKTPTLTPTSASSPLPSCDTEKVLREIKSAIPYAEYSVTSINLFDKSRLGLWFVDQDLDPEANGDSILENATLAAEHAIDLSHQLASEIACIEELFDVIHSIVVDETYHGWYSGEVKPSSLLDLASLSAMTTNWFLENVTVDYARNQPTTATGRQPAPANACTWPEAEERIRMHFYSGLENMGFYLVIDEVGVNAWAHWVGYGEQLEIEFASLLNTSMEVRCLHPPIDWLWVFVVDNSANPKLLGRVPGEAVNSDDFMAEVINQFEVFYP